jgi:hypothetical protein
VRHFRWSLGNLHDLRDWLASLVGDRFAVGVCDEDDAGRRGRGASGRTLGATAVDALLSRCVANTTAGLHQRHAARHVGVARARHRLAVVDAATLVGQTRLNADADRKLLAQIGRRTVAHEHGVGQIRCRRYCAGRRFCRQLISGARRWRRRAIGAAGIDANLHAQHVNGSQAKPDSLAYLDGGGAHHTSRLEFAQTGLHFVVANTSLATRNLRACTNGRQTADQRHRNAHQRRQVGLSTVANNRSVGRH